MTGALWFVGKGNWELAVFFYVMATIGFMAGNVFYDSLLPAVAKKEASLIMYRLSDIHSDISAADYCLW